MKVPARQYTIRSIPAHVDRALRRRARASGKSFNQVALEALTEGAGESLEVFDDLDFMVGSMTESEAQAVEREITAQRQIDAKLWR